MTTHTLLNYRAAEFADKGYSVTDIDALTGAQRAPFLRFDDQGRLFGALPEQMTPEVRAMLYLDGASNVPALTAYMLNSALDRQAIAPMWEVKTARMQQEAGDPNAGLAAAVDSAYAQSHPNDANASNKRAGHFLPIGIDLDKSGTVSTVSIAQTEASPSTGSGQAKRVGHFMPTVNRKRAGQFMAVALDMDSSGTTSTEILAQGQSANEPNSKQAA